MDMSKRKKDGVILVAITQQILIFLVDSTCCYTVHTVR